MKWILTVVLGWVSLSQVVFAQPTYLYVVDVGPSRNGPHQVLRYDADGSNPMVFIDQGLSRPQDIIFIESKGEAIVSNLGSNRITRHDAETGEYIDDFATGLGQPTRMAIGPDGLLYVVEWVSSGRVQRFDLDGNFIDTFTNFNVPNGIGLDWDADGNLHVSSFNLATVRKFSTTGSNQGLHVTSGLFGPTNIWFEDDGNLMVMDWSGGAIRRYDSNGQLLSNVVTNVSEPEGVEFLDNGHFLIGHGGNSPSVKQYRPNGGFVQDLVPNGFGGLGKPNGLRLRTINPFTINAGLNDAWFNASTAGQGVFVNVFPVIGKIFVAMFTYDSERPDPGVMAMLGEPGHRWVTAFGDYSGNMATLDVELTSGGVFDSGEPAVTQVSGYGTFKLTFADCSSLTLEYSFPDQGLQGTIELVRVAEDNVALCQALDGD